MNAMQGSLLKSMCWATSLVLISSGAWAQSSATRQVSSCFLLPSHEVIVGTPLDGVLEVVSADRGELVKAGQVIAKMNTGLEQAQVQTQEARAEFGDRKARRNEDLYQKRVISDHELDEIKTETNLAKLELEERKQQLKLRTIVSPISGVIVDKYRARGDLVKQEKIFKIAAIDPLNVELVVNSRMFGQFKQGQVREVNIPLLNKKVSGKVTSLDRVIDPASGTFRVRLSVPNPGSQIPSGLQCEANFN
jgi:membrane fusion protein (multidrug efflux system)